MAYSLSLHRVGPAARGAGKHRAKGVLPPLGHKERVLGRYDSGAGQAVATDHALLLGDRAGTWRRFAWPSIAGATKSPADQSLTLRLWPSGADSPQHVHVAVDHRLAAIIRERIDYHQLLSVPVELPNGITGRVLALRDGDAVRWLVSADAPLDSPAVQRACEAAIDEIRSLSGL